MKRLIFVMLIVLTVFLLCSCGGYKTSAYVEKVETVFYDWEKVREYTDEDFSKKEQMNDAYSQFCESYSDLVDYQTKYAEKIEENGISYQTSETVNSVSSELADPSNYYDLITEYKRNYDLAKDDEALLSKVIYWGYDISEVNQAYLIDIYYTLGIEKSSPNINIKSENELWAFIKKEYEYVGYEEILNEEYNNKSVFLSGIVKNININKPSSEYSEGLEYYFELYFQNDDGTFSEENFSFSEETLKTFDDYRLKIYDKTIQYNGLNTLKKGDSVDILVYVYSDGSFGIKGNFAIRKVEPIYKGEIKVKESDSNAEYDIEEYERDSLNSTALYNKYIDDLKSNTAVSNVDEIANGQWVIYVDSAWSLLSTEQKQELVDSIYFELNSWSSGMYSLEATIVVKNEYGKVVAESKWFGSGMELK